MPRLRASEQALTVDKSERDIGGRRGPRRLNLAAPGIESRQPDGSEPDRQRPAVAEQLGRQIDIRHVAQDALPERDGLQILDVPPERHLVV